MRESEIYPSRPLALEAALQLGSAELGENFTDVHRRTIESAYFCAAHKLPAGGEVGLTNVMWELTYAECRGEREEFLHAAALLAPIYRAHLQRMRLLASKAQDLGLG